MGWSMITFLGQQKVPPAHAQRGFERLRGGGEFFVVLLLIKKGGESCVFVTQAGGTWFLPSKLHGCMVLLQEFGWYHNTHKQYYLTWRNQ
jgi:hypothetical protein